MTGELAPQGAGGEKRLEITEKNRKTSKKVILLSLIAALLIISASSIFLRDSRAYLPPAKPDPAAGSPWNGPGIHYAIGTNRVVCFGCTGPQPNFQIPSSSRT